MDKRILKLTTAPFGYSSLKKGGELAALLLLLSMAVHAQGQGLGNMRHCVRIAATKPVVSVAVGPGTINGTLSMCKRRGCTLLTGTVAGGTWSSDNTALVTVGSTNGICQSQGT